MSISGIGEVFDLGSKILDKLVPDANQKAQMQLDLLKLQQSGELASLTAETDLAKAQQDVNVEEAKSEDLFTRGWRPFVGWVCGIGLATQFIVSPMAVFGASIFGKVLVFPVLDIGTLLTLLFGMLGLGAYRTVEKINKVK